MKHSSSSHFADDTCLLYAQNKIKSLETNSNCLWSIQVVVSSLMTLAWLYALNKIKSLETNSNCLWSIQVVVSSLMTLAYYMHKIK